MVELNNSATVFYGKNIDSGQSGSGQFDLYTNTATTNKVDGTTASFTAWTSGGNFQAFPPDPADEPLDIGPIADAILALIDSAYVQARVTTDNFWSYKPAVGPSTGFVFNPTTFVPVGIKTDNPSINYALDVNGAVHAKDGLFVNNQTVGKSLTGGTSDVIDAAYIRTHVNGEYINTLVEVSAATIADFVDSAYVSGIIDSNYILSRATDSSYWQRNINTLHFGSYPAQTKTVDVGIGTDSVDAGFKFQVVGRGIFDSGAQMKGNLNVYSFTPVLQETFKFKFEASDLDSTDTHTTTASALNTIYGNLAAGDSDFVVSTSFTLGSKYIDVYHKETSSPFTETRLTGGTVVAGDSLGLTGTTVPNAGNNFDFIVALTNQAITINANRVPVANNLFIVNRNLAGQTNNVTNDGHIVFTDSDDTTPTGLILDYNTIYSTFELQDSKRRSFRLGLNNPSYEYN